MAVIRWKIYPIWTSIKNSEFCGINREVKWNFVKFPWIEFKGRKIEIKWQNQIELRKDNTLTIYKMKKKHP